MPKTIELTQGKVALVDDELFERLNRVKWYAIRYRKTFYAARMLSRKTGTRKQLRMHNAIFEVLGMKTPRGYTPDHADGDGLNNQLSNLRLATHIGQSRNRRKHANNTSGYIGVSWHKGERNWQSYAYIDGKQIHLGRFADPFSAAWARDQFVKKHYGDFAVLNNLQDRRQRVRAA